MDPYPPVFSVCSQLYQTDCIAADPIALLTFSYHWCNFSRCAILPEIKKAFSENTLKVKLH